VGRLNSGPANPRYWGLGSSVGGGEHGQVVVVGEFETKVRRLQVLILDFGGGTFGGIHEAEVLSCFGF